MIVKQEMNNQVNAAHQANPTSGKNDQYNYNFYCANCEGHPAGFNKCAVCGYVLWA